MLDFIWLLTDIYKPKFPSGDLSPHITCCNHESENLSSTQRMMEQLNGVALPQDYERFLF